MAYDLHLEDRIKQILDKKKIVYYGKKMMGGWCAMVDDKMCVGIVKNELMARIDPDIQNQALKKKGCRVMDFTGRPMTGYVFVSPEGIDMDKDLEYWILLCLDYNPKAKSSKKKK
jgi:TfoX/Sxy family transcriptional regulator of competence genes